MEQETKISELPNLTNLNAADLLAIVQGGVTYHTDFAKLLAFVFGNISVVETSNGTSVRIPGAQIQIVFTRVTQTFSSQTSRASSFAFPEPFANTDYIPIGVSGPETTGLETVRHDTNYAAGFMGYVQRTPSNFSGQVSSYWIVIGKY